MSTTRPFSLRQWSLLILILLVAAFFRLHLLDTIPPALFHDEAVNGLDVLNLLRTREIPLFFADNNGREPLLIYLQAVAVALFGSRDLSLRLVSAYSGLLTVAITGGVVKSLFAQRPSSFHVMALAMLVIAVSYWHVHFSRIAFRAILMLPLVTCMLWFFWRGWQGRRWQNFAAAGVLMGLSFYTYIPARIAPLIIVGTLAIDAFDQHQKGNKFFPQKSLLKGTLLLFLIAALIVAPLALYYLTHQDDFGARSQQVSIFAASTETGQSLPVVFLRQTWETMRMFVDKGHHYPALNLPYRPALDWLTAGGFIVGVLLAFYRWRQVVYPFLLLWLGVMLLPTILSNEGAHPLRALGAIVPAAVLAALGLELVGNQVIQRLHRPRLWPVYLLLIGLVSGMITYRDYFLHWGYRQDTIKTFSTAYAQIGRRLLTGEEALLLPAEIFDHPTTQFPLQTALANIDPDEQLSLPETAVSLYPAHLCRLQSEMILWQRTGETAAYRRLAAGQINRDAWLRNEASTAYADAMNRTITWETKVDNLTQEAAIFPRHIGENFNHEWCLLAFDLRPRSNHPAGSDLELVLYWEQLAELLPAYSVEITLENSAGDWLVTVLSPQITRPSQFGTVTAQNYAITLPDEFDLPGKFRFRIRLLDSNLEEIPLMNKFGLPYDALVLTDYVVLGEPAITAEDIPHPGSYVLGEPPLLTFMGYDSDGAGFQPGNTATVTLYWQSRTPIANNYSVFVHLVDENGNVISQHDNEPGNGRFPTGTWFPYEIIRDAHTLTLPPDAPPGPYTLAVGMYDWQTGARLPITSAGGTHLPNDQLILEE